MSIPRIPRSQVAAQQILDLAHDLIVSPQTWTRMPSAVNHAGVTVNVFSLAAVRFGAVGAIDRAGHELRENPAIAHKRCEDIARRRYRLSLGRVNTERGHHQVLNILDDARGGARRAA